MNDANQQLENLIRDFEDVKRSVKRNNPILRELSSPTGLGGMSTLFGLVLIAGGGVFQWAAWFWGAVERIPTAFRAIGFSSFVLIFIVATIVKWSVLSRRARGANARPGLPSLFRLYFSGPQLHVYLPVLIAFVGASVWLVATGHGWFISPALAVATGILATSLGSSLDLGKYTAMGYVLLAGGIAALPAMTEAPFLATGLAFGAALAVFGFHQILDERRKRKGAAGGAE